MSTSTRRRSARGTARAASASIRRSARGSGRIGADFASALIAATTSAAGPVGQRRADPSSPSATTRSGSRSSAPATGRGSRGPPTTRWSGCPSPAPGRCHESGCPRTSRAGRPARGRRRRCRGDALPSRMPSPGDVGARREAGDGGAQLLRRRGRTTGDRVGEPGWLCSPHDGHASTRKPARREVGEEAAGPERLVVGVRRDDHPVDRAEFKPAVGVEGDRGVPPRGGPATPRPASRAVVA